MRHSTRHPRERGDPENNVGADSVRDDFPPAEQSQADRGQSPLLQLPPEFPWVKRNPPKRAN